MIKKEKKLLVFFLIFIGFSILTDTVATFSQFANVYACEDKNDCPAHEICDNGDCICVPGSECWIDDDDDDDDGGGGGGNPPAFTISGFVRCNQNDTYYQVAGVEIELYRDGVKSSITTITDEQSPGNYSFNADESQNGFAVRIKNTFNATYNSGELASFVRDYDPNKQEYTGIAEWCDTSKSPGNDGVLQCQGGPQPGNYCSATSTSYENCGLLGTSAKGGFNFTFSSCETSTEPTTPPGDPTSTPTPSPTAGPTITPPPPPPLPPDAAEYIIDVGTKQSLTIQIGAGTTSQIRFRARLAHTQNNPDMYLKLRAVDELAFIDNPSGSAASCDAPPAGGKDFWVAVRADANGIYSPVSQTNAPAPQGGTVASVSSDGWVALPGLSSGKYYSFLLKSPKSRGTKMVEHEKLQPSQSQQQDFDWTGNPLFPGDLPDPNNSNKQDCTVNSIDLSLIESRLGTTDQANLDIGDVNYDGMINANDISKVINTLSTKPDDDI